MGIERSQCFHSYSFDALALEGNIDVAVAYDGKAFDFRYSDREHDAMDLKVNSIVVLADWGDDDSLVYEGKDLRVENFHSSRQKMYDSLCDMTDFDCHSRNRWLHPVY